jgi:hypothetical protein
LSTWVPSALTPPVVSNTSAAKSKLAPTNALPYFACFFFAYASHGSVLRSPTLEKGLVIATSMARPLSAAQVGMATSAGLLPSGPSASPRTPLFSKMGESRPSEATRATRSRILLWRRVLSPVSLQLEAWSPMQSKSVCMHIPQATPPFATTAPSLTRAATVNCLLPITVSNPSTEDGTAEIHAPAWSQVSLLSLCASRLFGASVMSRASLALSISNDASFWLAVADAGGNHISPHVIEVSARLAEYATLACSDTLRRPMPPNLGVREA